MGFGVRYIGDALPGGRTRTSGGRYVAECLGGLQCHHAPVPLVMSASHSLVLCTAPSVRASSDLRYRPYGIDRGTLQRLSPKQGQLSECSLVYSVVLLLYYRGSA